MSATMMQLESFIVQETNMLDIILGLGMVIFGFMLFWAVLCFILKGMFKIADKIFG